MLLAQVASWELAPSAAWWRRSWTSCSTTSLSECGQLPMHDGGCGLMLASFWEDLSRTSSLIQTFLQPIRISQNHRRDQDGQEHVRPEPADGADEGTQDHDPSGEASQHRQPHGGQHHLHREGWVITIMSNSFILKAVVKLKYRKRRAEYMRVHKK